MSSPIVRTYPSSSPTWTLTIWQKTPSAPSPSNGLPRPNNTVCNKKNVGTNQQSTHLQTMQPTSHPPHAPLRIEGDPLHISTLGSNPLQRNTEYILPPLHPCGRGGQVELPNHAHHTMENITETHNSNTITFVSFKHNNKATPESRVLEWDGTTHCPVTLLKAYLQIRPGPQDGHLFRHKNGSTMSASELGQILKRTLHLAGFDTSAITPHSLRIGATTTVVSQGASLSQLKLLGRWKSDAYKSYIHPKTQNPIPFVGGGGISSIAQQHWSSAYRQRCRVAHPFFWG